MRRLTWIFAALLLLAPALAEAKKRVVLLGIEGDSGQVVKEAVDEVLRREHTVVSDAAFRRSRQRLGVVTLSDEGYALVAADLSADAVVSGVMGTAGKRRRLILIVREGRSGKVSEEIVLFFPGITLGAAGTDAIAAKLLPAIAATAPILAGTTAAEPEPPASQPAPPPVAPPSPAAEEDLSALETTPSEPGGVGTIGGKAFAYVRGPINGDEQFQQVSASLWLRAHPKLTDSTSATFELAIDGFDVSLGGDRRTRITVREAYVTLKQSGWLVRVGQQSIPWGSADVVNPTDFLTARDYTTFGADTEQGRVSAVSLLASRAWPGLEITVAITPLHPVSRLLIPPSALPEGVTIAEPAEPNAALRNTELAAKVKLSGARWDLAVVGFTGFNHLPELEVVQADESGIVLRQNNHHIDAVGLDGSVSFGKLVLRAEGAYVVTQNPLGTNPAIQPTYFAAVVGAELPIGDRLRVQVQFIERGYPSWEPLDSATGSDPALTIALRGVAAANALLLDYQDPARPGATLRLAYKTEDERFEAEVFAAAGLVAGDYLVRPLVGWRPSDAVMVQLGLELYGGPETQPLGALHRFGGAFGQVTYTF